MHCFETGKRRRTGNGVLHLCREESIGTQSPCFFNEVGVKATPGYKREPSDLFDFSPETDSAPQSLGDFSR